MPSFELAFCYTAFTPLSGAGFNAVEEHACAVDEHISDARRAGAVGCGHYQQPQVKVASASGACDTYTPTVTCIQMSLSLNVGHTSILFRFKKSYGRVAVCAHWQHTMSMQLCICHLPARCAGSSCMVHLPAASGRKTCPMLYCMHACTHARMHTVYGCRALNSPGRRIVGVCHNACLAAAAAAAAAAVAADV
jgi:hypothetical protein